MNNATIMGKIKNVPKIVKNEEGKEEAIISVEVERNYKNAEGKTDKDVIECRMLEPEENFKEEYPKGQSVAIQGKIDVDKKEFGENQIDNLFVDIKKIVPLAKNKNEASVNILGYLTINPELRKTENGKSVTNIVIAAMKDNKNEETTYIRSTVWNSRAETTSKYCQKGDLICIKGNLRTNTRTNETDKVSITELVADDIKFLQMKTQNNTVEQEQSKEQELD